MGPRANKCLAAACCAKQVFVRIAVGLLINLCWGWHCNHLGLGKKNVGRRGLYFCKLLFILLFERT